MKSQFVFLVVNSEKSLGFIKKNADFNFGFIIVFYIKIDKERKKDSLNLQIYLKMLKYLNNK